MREETPPLRLRKTRDPTDAAADRAIGAKPSGVFAKTNSTADAAGFRTILARTPATAGFLQVKQGKVEGGESQIARR